MPTLLQINSTLNFSSTGKIAEQIGLVAMEHGWTSYIAHGPRYVNESKNYHIQIGSSFGEKLHALSSRLFDNHGLCSTTETNKLIDFIKEIHPDIIHLHNIHGYFLNYKILFQFIKEYNIPIVWTLHDCWSFTGHCVYFDAVGCNKWKSGCGNCPQLSSYPSSFLIDRSRKNFCQKKESFLGVPQITLVPVSYWLEELINSSFLSTYHTEVIHNGIDLNIFLPRQSSFIRTLGLNGKYLILGVASGWSEGRRLNDFIKLSKYLASDEVIILIGLSNDQIQNLPQNIIGISRTNNQIELSEYYSICDVFVYPTYEDNFPTVNLEALACGTPVITYNTGGSPEAIDCNTGAIVDKGNIQELYNKICTFRKLGKSFFTRNCRDRAEKYFDNKKCFDKYLEIYNRMIGSI